MKCPVCQSARLSDETEYASFENTARFPEWEPGLIQWKALAVGAERARICLDCGFLLLFAGPEKLEKLRRGRAT